jgi:hypothetical protein
LDIEVHRNPLLAIAANVSANFMKKLHFILLLLLTVDLSAQKYPEISSNGYKSEIINFIKVKKDLRDYDFILIKSEDSYWYKIIDYRLVCFKNDQVDLIEIQKNKENNKFRINTKNKGIFSGFSTLIDSLKSIGLFDLKDTDLNTDKIDKDGNIQRRSISDGKSEIFEIYNSKDSWGIDIYEPKKFYDFCGNKNLLIILNSVDLFNIFWKNKNWR